MPRIARPAVALSPRRARRGGACAATRPNANPSRALEGLESRVLFAAGDLDPTFGAGGPDGDGIVTTNIAIVATLPTADAAQAVVIQPDQKILVGGTSGDGFTNDFALVRYNTDGSLDTTFGGDGIVTADFGDYDEIQSLALTSEGKVVAVGSTGSGNFADFAIARFNADGSLDPTFSPGASFPGGGDGDGRLALDLFTRGDVATGVDVAAGGKIVVTGTATGPTSDIVVVRLNPNGALDTTFAEDGQVVVNFFEGADAASNVIVQSDNKVVVVGGSAPPGSYRRFVLARFNPDGTPDTTFDTDGLATADFGGNAFGKDVLIDPAGGYVVGGLVDAPGGGDTQDFAVARFNPDGTLDANFGAGGRSVVTGFGGSGFGHYGLARQADGKLLLGGNVVDSANSTAGAFGIARFNANGTVDANFGTGGTVRTTVPGAAATTGADLALQADGRVVMVGDADPEGDAPSDFAVARYQNTVSQPASISGVVFEDVNANGVRDAGEPGIGGATLYHDANNNSTLDLGSATYTAADTPKPIPDQSSVRSNLTVAGAPGEIIDMNVTLTISHTFDPDLTVNLLSPSGTLVRLFSDVGNTAGTTGNANFTDTVFDDQATQSINAGRPPFRGTFRPQQPLAAFVGENANGVWELEILDTAAEDTGRLESWSVSITTRGEASTSSAPDGTFIFPAIAPGDYTIRQAPLTGFTQTSPQGGAHVITVADGQAVVDRNFGNFRGTAPASVVGRWVFYNNSAYDGRNVAANEADRAAVATDKRALMPGEAGTINNVTSYSRGINGIIVELSGLSTSANLTAADFQFRTGNRTEPGGFTAATPLQVVTLRSPVPEAPASVHITFADGAIVNRWLQVTVLSNANTGLTQPDVFYFGNLVGETGDSPPRLMVVTTRDQLLMRRALGSRDVGVTSHYDFDRDGDVDSMDLLTLRRNMGSRLSAFGGPDSGAQPASLVFSDTQVARPARAWEEQPDELI